MAPAGTETLDPASLQALLGPQLTAEQAHLIYEQGADAVVFALLSWAKPRAERPVGVSATSDPSTPSGQTPPDVKPTTKARGKPKGVKRGHPGSHRPTPPRIDRREEHPLSACPTCHGPVRPCRASRTRIIEDVPADIQKIRDLHVEMDKAVAAAYGWADLQGRGIKIEI